MRGIIRWFAANSVAANLLMIVIVAVGALTIPRLKLEVFPEISAGIVNVSVPYPGASPAEVEESVVVRIEEAIADIEGIKEITSVAAEGAGNVTVEVENDVDVRQVLDDVKVRVDAINTFPAETERAIISEPVLRKPVINVAISGAADEWTLKRIAERVREELLALEEITQAEVVNTRAYEISVEVTEDALRRYGLDFDAVAGAVRRASINLPGGVVKAEGGQVILRTQTQAYTGEEFENLVLLTAPGGRRIRLGDVARVVDGFTDSDQSARFDGQPSVQVQVYRVGDQNALELSELVREYVEEAQLRMPPGIELAPWADESIILRDRLNLMLRNGGQGLALVFVVLAIFLKFRLAFWVSLGIPISFLGAIALQPALGSSINLISLFAFILVLGIVVDDAIIVGESAYRYQQRGRPGLAGAVEGAIAVGRPVMFAVTTTIVAFAPMASLPGIDGKFWVIIPAAVIPCLLFSLVESLLILPAHLSHESKFANWIGTIPPFSWWGKLQGAVANSLVWFAERVYQPILELLLRWRYATLGAGAAMLFVTVGAIGGGHLRFVFFPTVEADNVVAQVRMPVGTPVSETAEAIASIEAAIPELMAEFEPRNATGDPDDHLFRHWLTSIGGQPFKLDQEANGGVFGGSYDGSHLGEINIQLRPAEDRLTSSPEIANRWRELVGEVPGAVELDFVADLIAAGQPIHVRLIGRNLDVLQSMATEVKDHLAGYPGVYGIADTFQGGKRELQFDLTPFGESLGLSRLDVARQLRQGFYGEEAQRIQRGRDDVKVMVRYPEADRGSLYQLEEMRVRTPAGLSVPLAQVAVPSETVSFNTINRADRRRTVEITADFDTTASDNDAGDVREALETKFLPDLVARHPGTSFEFVGEQKRQRDTLQELGRLYMLALLGIFALMAIPFRSYLQPLIVMSAIPFGLVGAIGGHILTGNDFSILSVLGIVALGGVVVNDSLVLVDYVNRARSEGRSALDAAVHAGGARFRAILLTSLTTFAGLTPLMLEKSVQAQFLVPMAVSLAFGVLFATFITLVLVPCLYLGLEDVRKLLGLPDVPLEDPVNEFDVA
jgi:multidrug efflux pump subunit AcrB